MEVSINGGTPKSSIWIGLSFLNHPFWGCPMTMETAVCYTPGLIGTPVLRQMITGSCPPSKQKTERSAWASNFNAAGQVGCCCFVGNGSIDASCRVSVLLIILNIKWFRSSQKPLFIRKLRVLMHGVAAASWVHDNFASHVACLSMYPFGTGSKTLELAEIAWWISSMSY